jgi:hypothetical protein
MKIKKNEQILLKIQYTKLWRVSEQCTEEIIVRKGDEVTR